MCHDPSRDLPRAKKCEKMRVRTKKEEEKRRVETRRDETIRYEAKRDETETMCSGNETRVRGRTEREKGELRDETGLDDVGRRRIVTRTESGAQE